GNIYTLDGTLLTDDDYGLVNPYYTTYFFINHETEQALQVGSHRKLFTYISLYVSGTGTISLTPLVDSLTNARNNTKPHTLFLDPAKDQEWGLNVTGERVAFKIATAPLAGTTDNGFNLNKMVVTLRQDPWSPVAGRV